MKITIIEDEKILASRIGKKLNRNGYLVSIYNTAEEFQSNYSNNSALYIIDIGLPGSSGFELIKWLRKEKQSIIPIIITSGYSDTDSKIYGLDIGADDYLPKPFSSEELLARIRCNIRRNLNPTNTGVIIYKNIEFNLNSKKVSVDKKNISLTKKEIALVEFFLYNKSRLITKTELIQSVWGEQELVFVSDNTINVTISKVRKKLGNNFNLETRINEGYILDE